jgi:hypothetical protein
MPATFRQLSVAAAVIAAVAACDDPYAVEAQRTVVADTTLLYSVSSAPIGAPTAYYLLGASSRQAAVVANASFAFDVAVQVSEAGGVQLITPRALIGVPPDPQVYPHRVGLQRVDGAFDALTLAPVSGYTYDSLLTVTPGQTIALQSANPNACPVLYLGQHFYAKLVVDSVRTAPARVYLRATTDPNCDFRSLVPGAVPEE